MNATAVTQQHPEPAPPREIATPNLAPSERKLWAIVDGDSASWGSPAVGGKPSLSNLGAVLDELADAGIPFDAIVASYSWKVKGLRDGFAAFASRRGLILAPTGTKTDSVVLQLAQKRKAQGYVVYLVSNDCYKEYPAAKDFPRIGFSITRDGLVATSPEVHELAKAKPGGDSPATASESTIRTP